MIWSEFLFGAVEIFSVEWMFAHTLITATLGGNVTLPSVILANSNAFLPCISK